MRDDTHDPLKLTAADLFPEVVAEPVHEEPTSPAPVSAQPKLPTRPDRRQAAANVLHVRGVTGCGGGPEKTILRSPRYTDPARYKVTAA